MALVILLFSFLSFAQTCPPQRVLPSLPVHDQDGLGTCASNTAALMMQHNLGLAQSPSYFQLSLTTSGKEKSSFFFNDEKNERRIFNWGAHICDVIKTAKDDGFCDHSIFQRDAIGREDQTWSQQNFLVNLAEYLTQNRDSLRSLGRQLQNPTQREAITRNLSQFFLRRSETCRYDYPEFLARRALSRLAPILEAKINASTGAEKVKYQTMKRETFDLFGDPTERAITFYKSFLGSVGSSLLGSRNLANIPGGTNSLPDESLFIVWWGNELRLQGSRLTYPFRNMFVSDHQAYRPCGREEREEALNFLRQTPYCSLAPQSPISDEFISQATNLVSSLTDYLAPGRDAEAGLVNLISPGCAAQMQLNRGREELGCNNLSINNAASANRAKERITRELCRGKAVAISMCTGMFKSAVPVNSNFCENDVPGVEGHGRHALTLIGYRTVGAKKQIKIQNSWGQTCPYLQNSTNAVPVALAQSVECEFGADGRPTGRFWVDEELLINNSYQLSVMP